MNWKVLTGVLLVLYMTVTCTKEIRDTNANIQNGLNLAKELGDLISHKNFTNVVVKLVTSVTPYLAIVGPLVGLILGQTEPPQLTLLKNLYKQVDNRFDQVDLQFKEVKDLIHWTSMKGQYFQIEQNIIAADRKLKDIYIFPKNAVNNAKTNFLRSYESDIDVGSKLYDGIMNEGLAFGDSIFSAALKYTKYDRAKCQAFMMGILQLLMKAAKLDLSYYKLKGQEGALHQYQSQWNNRFTHIGIKMLSTDNSIVSQYHTQSGEDIDNYLVKNLKNRVSNNDFNNGLYTFLAKKYYWRDWLTVTYNAITGGNNHWVGQCEGHTKFRQNDRNVVVASVDPKKKGHINMAQAKSIVDHVDNCHPKTTNGYTAYHRTDSNKAYNTFPASVKDHCSPYAAKGVISYTKHNGNDVHFKAAPNRMYVKNQENCNFVFLFG